MSGELRFISSPASREYRENFDRIFKASPIGGSCLASDNPGPLTPVIECTGPCTCPGFYRKVKKQGPVFTCCKCNGTVRGPDAA